MDAKQKLTDLRNQLYNDMGTGNVNAFDLIKVIKNHLDELDNFIDNVLPHVSGSLPDLDIDKAEELAWKTDYACFAVEEDGNEIIKVDAGAFFLEGYNYAKSNLR